MHPYTGVNPMKLDRETRHKCLDAAIAATERVADQLNWSPRKVVRRYRRGDPQVVAMVAGEAAVLAQDIDPDRLREILQVILEFVMALLAMFS